MPRKKETKEERANRKEKEATQAEDKAKKTHKQRHITAAKQARDAANKARKEANEAQKKALRKAAKPKKSKNSSNDTSTQPRQNSEQTPLAALFGGRSGTVPEKLLPRTESIKLLNKKIEELARLQKQVDDNAITDSALKLALEGGNNTTTTPALPAFVPGKTNEKPKDKGVGVGQPSDLLAKLKERRKTIEQQASKETTSKQKKEGRTGTRTRRRRRSSF